MQLAFQDFAHESNAGEVLAQSVVQVFTDAALLARADFQNCFFEALALSHVDSGDDDV